MLKVTLISKSDLVDAYYKVHELESNTQREWQMKINMSSSLILFSKKLVGGTQILAPLPIGFAIFLALLVAVPITGRQVKELGGYSRLQ